MFGFFKRKRDKEEQERKRRSQAEPMQLPETFGDGLGDVIQGVASSSFGSGSSTPSFDALSPAPACASVDTSSPASVDSGGSCGGGDAGGGGSL
jgi:hypothetical protein